MRTKTLVDLIDRTAAESGFSGVVHVAQSGSAAGGEDGGGSDGPDRVTRAYGYAERSNRVPNRPDTRFGIASGTKLLTALALGILMDRGELAPESRVKDLVSFELPGFAHEVTIHHLLTHTSGIFDYYDEELVEDFDNYFVDIPWNFLTTPRDYLPLFQHEGMKFAPGERFSYSNGGYILLGIVIEEVTGGLYREFVTKEVFGPAGMDDSGFFALNELPERTAVGYMPKEDGGFRTNVYNLPIIGASDGGAFLTAADSERLWTTFFEGGIVTPTTREAFLTPWSRVHETVDYGYGIYIWKGPGVPAYFFSGSDAGVGFDSRHFPETGVTITILSNITDGEAAMRKVLLFEQLEATDAIR
jgi:CubicO group peptidase (beta-lactamase class C family)